jgi:ribonuclease HI
MSGRWVRRDFWVSEPDTTNQRMAIRSGIEGLRRLKRRCHVRFVSDSRYLVDGMRTWLPNWKARGWKRKGGAIENLDLWKELDRLAGGHDVEWSWVKGHAGHPGNEYANHLAVRAATRQDDSAGLVPSEFEAWLEKERDRGRYLDFYEFEGPAEDGRDGDPERPGSPP